MIFRERCLDSLLDNFEECYKRQETLQRAEKEAWQRCKNETKVLKQKVDQLDTTLRKETERRGALLREALLATRVNAAARTEQIQCQVSAVVAQADLDIAKKRMELPGRQWSEELMAARYHALNGSAVQDAQSRYLDAYEGAIRSNEASLMVEDMELVALHLSWSTKRVTPTRSCKCGLDEKWTHCIDLCQLRAAQVRSAYEASKAFCRDDLQTRYATAANELSGRRKDRFKKGAELDTKVQKVVDAIAHQRDKELVKLQANITEIEERRHWQAEKLRAEYKTQLSSLKGSMQPLVESLLSAIKKRQKVFDREQDILAKDLRAAQATLTLMTSAIQTLIQDRNSFPDKHTQPPPSNQDGWGACPCPCGCGRRGPSRFARSFFPRFSTLFNFDPRQRTYERFEKRQRADESRRQREVDEDELLRNEERSRRKREEQRSREAAKAQARAEREARMHLREQAERRREEETRRREEETRRRREDEERRRAEADRRAREEEERKKRQEEETRKRAEEEERRREDARRHEEEERRRAEADRRAREEEEESRKRAEEEERRREDDRRREEEESRRREEGRRHEGENQQDRQEQQHSNNDGGENAQGATDEDEIEDDDRAGGTSGHSTAKGRTKFILKCWNKYTEVWRKLMASEISRLRFQEIPWPVLPPRKRNFTRMSIADILSRISKESIRTFILDPEHLQSISPKVRIRKELLRFHPDKRVQWLKNVKDEEKEQVDEACEQVVHHLTDLLNTVA